jgi:epoxyqueuosine reductase
MLSGLFVKERALDLGFDLAGIAPLQVWKDLEFSRKWVEKGFNGGMRYLEKPERFDPLLVLPSAKSVICVGLIYNAQLPYSTEAIQVPTRAWISRYAWGRDYHEVMRAKLEQLRDAVKELAPGVETRVFVDTGPVVERAFARLSGIGWMGKNTCIINEEKGSWFFLGVILTSLELAPDLPAPDRCGSCTACLEACPTGALVEPYVMDASRCISYLTIELRGPIPEKFRPKIAGNVFGCDICQDVCPWNKSYQPSAISYQQAKAPPLRPNVSHQPSAINYQQASSQQGQPSERRYVTHPATTQVPQFHPMIVKGIHPAIADSGTCEKLTTGNGQRTTDNGPGTTDHGPPTADAGNFSLFHPLLEALASISEEGFRRIFAHSPIKRAKYRGWLRNLSVAMGNSGDQRFVPWLQRAAQHSDPVVREHARWALERLRGQS